MSEAKFTKGPWKVHSNCEVSYDECGLVTIYNTYLVESIANAHLIAAAPDNYYAAVSAMRLLESLGLESSDEYQALANSTAKARGEL